MPKNRSWTDEQLRNAVLKSKSYRNVLIVLGLIPAGGNYAAVQQRIKELDLDTAHFTGKGWNVGWKFDPRPPAATLEVLLVRDRPTQSFKLKQRLFKAKLKKPQCELCGWKEKAPDGRVPVELDHINGVHDDNRLENLRILCPNCHSLQPTHRGKNKKHRLVSAGVVTGSQD